MSAHHIARRIYMYFAVCVYIEVYIYVAVVLYCECPSGGVYNIVSREHTHTHTRICNMDVLLPATYLAMPVRK